MNWLYSAAHCPDSQKGKNGFNPSLSARENGTRKHSPDKCKNRLNPTLIQRDRKKNYQKKKINLVQNISRGKKNIIIILHNQQVPSGTINKPSIEI